MQHFRFSCFVQDDGYAERVVGVAPRMAQQWLQRLTCLIVGPGLGDNRFTSLVTQALIKYIAKHLTL
jgi:hypothetical protein